MKAALRAVVGLITALGCLGSMGCVSVVENPPAPVRITPLTEPLCHDWSVTSESVSPEGLGFWGLRRSQLAEVVEETFRSYGALPDEHLDEPAMTFLRLRLQLEEVKEEPAHSLNLLSLCTLGLWPYRTEYRLLLKGILFGPKTNVAAGTSEEERILTTVESEVTVVSWSQLFLLFYVPAYTSSARAEPFTEALQGAAANVCTRLIGQFQALLKAEEERKRSEAEESATPAALDPSGAAKIVR